MERAYGVSPEPMSRVTNEKSDRIPLVVVAGPTASGKSELAIRIAQTFDGEVINADSTQVYRELEILTARPGREDLARVRHHLFAIRSLSEPCSVATWLELAVPAIEAVHARGRVPVLCGGTGFYIRALLEGLAAIPEIPDATRLAAREKHQEMGGAAFRSALEKLDPLTAARLADGDSQRLVRAWEVVIATGRSLTDWQADEQGPALRLDPHTIALMPEREALYAACDGRFEAMVRHGALDEARQVAALTFDPSLPGMKALGLPELLSHLRGDITLDEATVLAQRATRRYAKRQTTWFRHQFVPKMPIHTQYSKRLEERIFPIIRRLLLTPST
jgi:tRNA dimethylallyltransferase